MKILHLLGIMWLTRSIWKAEHLYRWVYKCPNPQFDYTMFNICTVLYPYSVTAVISGKTNCHYVISEVEKDNII